MLAKDVMTPRVITVLEDTPVQEVARTLLESRISAVPVVSEDGQLVGIVSEGDLMRRAESETERDGSWWLAHLHATDDRARMFAKARGRLAKDVMTTSVITANEGDTLSELATRLEENRIKRVPVVRKGKVVGIVSRANLLHGLAALPEPTAERKAAKKPAATPSRGRVLSDDAAIRATIVNTLHNEVGIDRVINVIVSDGVVDLWGGVQSEAERQAVCAAAENVPNVDAVNDHLSVMPAPLRHLLHAD